MRWWIYQKERFPVFQHGFLIAAFSSSAVSFTSLLIDKPPRWQAYLVAFVVCFLFFLQLRIADEFKDAEEDATFRPYRPVPRGLVSLRELGILFGLAAIAQVAVAGWLMPRLIVILVIAWIYLAMMSVEFFARDWLKNRPITYLWTHMLIMPLVDFFATSCQWIPHSDRPPSGLICFLAASFFNGIVIEIGRKLRQPEAEEEGVPTYSKLWGLRAGSAVWLGCMIATATLGLLAAARIGFLLPATAIFIVPIGLAAWRAQRYESTSSKTFELISGIWTLLLYLSLGLLPIAVK